MLKHTFQPNQLLQARTDAPFVHERHAYLVFLQRQGHSSRRLVQVNRVLLAAAERIDLSRDLIDLSEVTATAEASVDGRTRPGTQAQTIRSAKTDFASITCDWLQFLGRLHQSRPAIPFAGQLEEFLHHLASERGLSDRTVHYRKQTLVPFLSWLHTRGDSITTATPKTIADYFVVHEQCWWTRRTIASYVQSLRSFFRYAASRSWCVQGIAETIDRPSMYRHERLPQGPSWNDVQRLIATTRGDQATLVRDHAVVLLLSVYGFRIGEICNLRLDDLDWQAERIHLRRPKQREIQEYPLTTEVGEAILRYLREVRPRSAYREVFLRVRPPFRPITPAGLGSEIEAHIRRLGIRLPRYGPHALRHSCATHLLSEGFSLKEIGDHLGHRSSMATQVYAKVDEPSLRQVAERDLSDLIMYAMQPKVEPDRADSRIRELREVASLSLGGLL